MDNDLRSTVAMGSFSPMMTDYCSCFKRKEARSIKYFPLYQVSHIDILEEISYPCGTNNNESTAGADASVEMPKLHNIKLLIAFHNHACKLKKT